MRGVVIQATLAHENLNDLLRRELIIETRIRCIGCSMTITITLAGTTGIRFGATPLGRLAYDATTIGEYECPIRMYRLCQCCRYPHL